MAKPSTLLLRRLGAKRKIVIGGAVHYADSTEVGTVIDATDTYTRERNPITLERFIPAHRPPATNPPGLMAPPIIPATWEVVESFGSFETALPRAAKAKQENFYQGQTLRVRDRKTNDVIMVDIL